MPLLTAKADYIVKHLLAVKTELDTQNFHTLGMLVVRTRKHIIWYTRYLRHMIESLDPQLVSAVIFFAFRPPPQKIEGIAFQSASASSRHFRLSYSKERSNAKRTPTSTATMPCEKHRHLF